MHLVRACILNIDSFSFSSTCFHTYTHKNIFFFRMRRRSVTRITTLYPLIGIVTGTIAFGYMYYANKDMNKQAKF